MGIRVPDDIDRALLTALRANARTSLAGLGETVRLSRNAVRQRIERLERDGYIRGYTIVEAGAGGAEETVAATLLIDRADRLRGGEVIAALNGIPEVVQCDVVSGQLDLVVRVEAADPGRIREIWQQIADLPGVRDITTALTLRRAIDRPR